MGEFDLIERFFKRKSAATRYSIAPTATDSVALGIGDDCALIQPAPGQQLAVSSDMLVEGRHFFADVDPAALGHKALAVNLSDLAAMGAEPLAFTLALALPPARAADAAWLQAFSDGLLQLAAAHRCPLIGGDTTVGPLNLCITILGQVPAAQALRRDGARAGDDLWVSGTLGGARLALEALQGLRTLPPGMLAAARQRLERPTPRVALGLALRGIASSAIDLSDGLLGDVGHVLAASRAGATIDTSIASLLIAVGEDTTLASAVFDTKTALTLTLAGGDDYELAFTAPPAARAAVEHAGAQAATRVTRIGRIEAAPGLRLIDGAGRAVEGDFRSFDHFA